MGVEWDNGVEMWQMKCPFKSTTNMFPSWRKNPNKAQMKDQVKD